MTPDPYPDLSGGAVDRTGLSDADSRLLDVLSQPTTPVVSAVEDEARTAADDLVEPLPAGRRGAAAPVFQEPTPVE